MLPISGRREAGCVNLPNRLIEGGRGERGDHFDRITGTDKPPADDPGQLSATTDQKFGEMKIDAGDRSTGIALFGQLKLRLAEPEDGPQRQFVERKVEGQDLSLIHT